MLRLLTLSSLFVTSILNAEPIPLTNNTLDQISAGTVELSVNAIAQGEGYRAQNIAITNVKIEEQPDNGSGFIYTVSTGEALAYSRGEQISTEVGYSLTVTDEKIVSFSLEQTFSSGVASKPRKKINKSNKKRNNKRKSKKYKRQKNKRKTGRKLTGKRKQSKVRPRVIEQQQTLSLKVVTVQTK